MYSKKDCNVPVGPVFIVIYARARRSVLSEIRVQVSTYARSLSNEWGDNLPKVDGVCILQIVGNLPVKVYITLQLSRELAHSSRLTSWQAGGMKEWINLTVENGWRYYGSAVGPEGPKDSFVRTLKRPTHLVTLLDNIHARHLEFVFPYQEKSPWQINISLVLGLVNVVEKKRILASRNSSTLESSKEQRKLVRLSFNFFLFCTKGKAFSVLRHGFFQVTPFNSSFPSIIDGGVCGTNCVASIPD